jgi:hypothetical protein
MRQSRDSSQFGAGLVSGVVLVLLAGVGFRAAQWLAARPQPQAIADWLTVARFSLFDVFTGICVVFMLGVIVWAAAYGPRP